MQSAPLMNIEEPGKFEDELINISKEFQELD